MPDDPRSSRGPSLWRSVFFGAAAVVALLWLVAAIDSRRAQSWALLNALFATPFAILSGAAIGGAVFSMRQYRYRRRTGPADARSATTGGARRLALGAIGVLIVGALKVATHANSGDASSVWLPALVGATAVVPFAFVAIVVREQAGPFVLGGSLGVAWACVLTFLLLAFHASLVTATGTDFWVWLKGFEYVVPVDDPLLVCVLFVLAVMLSRTMWRLTAALRHEAQSSLRIRCTFAAGVLCALAYGPAVAPPFVAAGARLRHDTAARQEASEQARIATGTSTLVSLRRTSYCLAQFSAASGGVGYPATLGALGPAGTTCLDSLVVAGHPNAAWHLRYQATAPDTVGRRDGYWLIAESSDPWMNVLYANASGAIFYTEYSARRDSLLHLLRRSPGATATLAPLPIEPLRGQYLQLYASPIAQLGELRRCILFQRKRPPASSDLNVCLRYRTSDGWYSEMKFFGFNPSFPYFRGVPSRYLVAFARAGDDSIPNAFTLIARSATRATDGIRSFFVDTAGAVHWTAEDRAAIGTDSALAKCEQVGTCHYGFDLGPS